MAEMKFGVSQLKEATPAAIKIVYRTLMGLVAIWGIVAPQFPEIPADTAHLIDRLCIIGLPVFYAFCQMIGVPKPE